MRGVVVASVNNFIYDLDTGQFGMKQEEFQTRAEERILEREQGLRLRIMPLKFRSQTEADNFINKIFERLMKEK